MKAAITTVVLDFGNVLVGWDPRRVWSDVLSDAEIDTFLAESDFARLNHAADAGRTSAQTRAELATLAPQHVSTYDRYWQHYERSLTGPIPGSAELVTALHSAGVRLLGLTNWSAETFHHAVVAAPVIGLLEDVVVSGREGMAKPDPAIFRLLVDRFGLVPQESLFVDDVPANIEGARSVGLHAHLFRGAEGLRAELLERGILPAA